MTMRLGLSMYGALQFPDAQLQNAVILSAPGKVTVWRVWLDWGGAPGGDSVRLFKIDGSLNRALLPRFEQFQRFAYSRGLYIDWQLGSGGYTAEAQQRHVASLQETFALVADLPNDAFTVNVANEFDNRFSDALLRQKVEAVRSAAPGKRVSVSLSYGTGAEPWYVEKPRLHAERFAEMAANGVDLDFYCSHPDRFRFENGQNAWSVRNREYFVNLRGELRDRGLGGPVWDDEGRRDGDQNAGGAGDDPTIEERVEAAQGAKDALCEVHIFHSDMAYFGSLDPSQKEIFTLGRIANEVIDGQPPTEPPEPPEPGTEPC